MLEGATITVEIAFLSIAGGLLLGLLLAVARLGRRGLAYRLATAWVEIARNTPALFQIYMIFFGLGSFGIQFSPYASVLMAVTFNNAGYLCEILRGGFSGIPKTQMSAARSLGMSVSQANRYILIPQVIRAVYHPITNQIVFAVITTSLGMVVGLKELSGVTQFEQSRTFRTFEYFIVAGAMYYIIAKIIVLLARLLGWRLLRSR
jgi:hydroxyproline transport system permease protein